MRWVTYVSPTDGHERPGLLRDGGIRGLDGSLLELLRAGELATAADRAVTSPVEVVDAEGTRLRAPLPTPPSIRDFLSFESHLRTAMASLGREPDPVWWQQPVFYFTNPAAVHGPDDEVAISPGSSAFDYEVEVAAVVGRAGADLTPDEAAGHIAGYTILVDWSARDVQGVESRMGLGPAKGKDGATSLGPVLVTPDELEPHRRDRGFDLRMSASVDGAEQGGGSWADIEWTFGEMIAYASRGTRVVPGDVIGSGTVGTGCLLELRHLDATERGVEPRPWLTPGRRVEVTVEQLGTLTATVVEWPSLVPLRPGTGRGNPFG